MRKTFTTTLPDGSKVESTIDVPDTIGDTDGWGKLLASTDDVEGQVIELAIRTWIIAAQQYIRKGGSLEQYRYGTKVRRGAPKTIDAREFRWPADPELAREQLAFLERQGIRFTNKDKLDFVN